MARERRRVCQLRPGWIGRRLTARRRSIHQRSRPSTLMKGRAAPRCAYEKKSPSVEFLNGCRVWHRRVSISNDRDVKLNIRYLSTFGRRATCVEFSWGGARPCGARSAPSEGEKTPQNSVSCGARCAVLGGGSELPSVLKVKAPPPNFNTVQAAYLLSLIHI